MREIKFRAWDIEENDFITDWNTGDYSAIEFIGDSARVIQCNLIDACVNGEHEQYEEYTDITENIEIMQYTGLKDKNGKDIYEGDFVYMPGTGRYQIKNPGWVFVTVCIEKTCLESFMFDNFFDYVDDDMQSVGWEVIGNIHENPELLEESK